MKRRWKHNILIICFFTCLIGLMLVFFMRPKETSSVSERRKLAAIPQFTWNDIQDKSYMEDLETYLLDHFPFREELRRMKAYFAYDVLGQLENNDIYVVDGYAGKLEYPLRESSVEKAAEKMQALKNEYFPQGEVYYAIVPDKNYFLAGQNGYPSLDYGRMKNLMQEKLTDMTYIDIWDTLTMEDYYKTDTHWRQERLQLTVERLGEEMGFTQYLMSGYEVQEIPEFYGVYYGQSALPLSSEPLYYLTNDTIKAATQWSLETDKTQGIYISEEEAGFDKYNIYLSGAQALQVIKSPLARTQKRLIIFRDSFTSSLAPLLLEAYQEIILVDTRYISSTLLGEYVDFEEPDTQILFLYNTLLLNNSSMLK